MKLLLSTVVAVSLLAVGCNRQQTGSEHESINKSAKAAKEQIQEQAQAQQQQVKAETKVAQAQVDAESARLKAEAAKQKSEAEVNALKDSAGSAGLKTESQIGSEKSAGLTSDQVLMTKVQMAIGAGARETSAELSKNIMVSADNGVVTLRGTVKSEAEKLRLEQKAKSVVGVSRVDNQLQVKSQ